MKVAKMAVLFCVAVLIAAGCGLFEPDGAVYPSTSTNISINFGMTVMSLSAGEPEDVVIMNVVVSGEDKYGIFRDSLADEPLVQGDGGEWQATVTDLPIGPELTFTARGYNSSGTEIYSGSANKVLTGDNDVVTVALESIGTGVPIQFPIVVSITRPAEIVESTTASVAIAVKGNADETLVYGITSGGGTYTPDGGTIALPSSGAGTINSAYGAPGTVDTYLHTFSVTNSQGNRVETDFNTLVVYGLTDAGVAIQFAPAVLSLYGKREGTDVIFEAEVSDDGEHGDLTYVWSWDGESGFVDRTTNPVVLTNYDETEIGTISLQVTDGDGLSTTVSFELVAGQFPDDLIIDGDPGFTPSSLDVFIANSGPNRVFFNDGMGNYTYSGQPIGAMISHDVALGDMDNDGDLDAYVSNSAVNLLWLNDGTGHFSATDGVSVLSSLASDLGDFDGDGDLDVFVANEGPNHILVNNGTGSFEFGPMAAGQASRSWDVALADFDSDGDLDAYVANISGSDRVWINSGSNHFSLTLQTYPGYPSLGVAAGDLDDDGDDDTFVTYGGGMPNRIWINDGHAAFTDSGQTLGSSTSEDVALGDLDSDGDLDAVVANVGGPSRVWINDGSGNFSPGQQFTSANALDIALGDIDGDGILDAMFAVVTGPNFVWFGYGDGTFHPGGLISGLTAPSRSLAFGALR